MGDQLEAHRTSMTTAAAQCQVVLGRAAYGPRALSINMGYDLTGIPGVVAQDYNVRSRFIELIADFWRDAEAIGRVFTIDDDEIQGQIPAPLLQVFHYDRAPGAANYIS